MDQYFAKYATLSSADGRIDISAEDKGASHLPVPVARTFRSARHKNQSVKDLGSRH
jgi:hypothetical protein